MICNFREMNSRKIFLVTEMHFFWKLIRKQKFMYVKIFSGSSVIISKIIPPDDFLCNFTATGLLLFVTGHAKDFCVVK